MTHNLQPYTWNGYSINDWNGTVGEWSGKFPVGTRGDLHATAVYSPIAYSFPKLSTTQLGEHYIVLEFHPKSVVAAHTLSYMRAQLEGWFNVLDFTPHQLIAQDTEDTNRQWYVAGIPVDFKETGSGIYQVVLALNDPVWRVVTQSTTGNVAVAASPNTQNLTILGNVPTPLVITIKPTSARTGSYGYRRYIPIYNTTTKAFPFGVSTVDVTNGGLDTATLIAAAKMLASGDDCRLFVDGVDSNRWFGGLGINTATTLVWANIPHSPGQVGILLTALPNNATTVDVTFKVTAANLAVLTALAKVKNKAFIIGSEVFTWSLATQVDLVNYKISSCKRAQKLTSAAAHSTGANITWIEHDVWLLYGNATADTPDIDDLKKPIIKLDTSLNTVWKWANMYDTLSVRPGEWTPVVVASLTNPLAKKPLTTFYTGDALARVNPSTELGLGMAETTVNNVPKAETANLLWSFYHPAGFSNSSMAGKKFLRYGLTWPALAGLYISNDNKNFDAAWNETIPALNTVTAFTHNAVAFGGTYLYVQLLFAGSIGAKVGNYAYLQGDTISLTLGTGKLTVSLNAENPNYQLTAQIKNNISGEYLIVNCLMGTNQVLTIDCGAKTCILDDGTNLFNAIRLSPNRINPDWLNVGQDSNNKFVGTAQMIYAEAGLVAETLSYSQYDASY